MDTDIILVIGVLLGVFSIPSILSAISEGRAPRVAAFTIIASGVLILYAINSHPGGYTLEDVPGAFVRVVAKFL
ncbi:hypothetical protein [Roseovarius sp. 2305UL8-3]|uniref:hypothetical protein n=1 Tax=Roseovarius conchicola TaxID=3121636 RepID=UPI003527B832